MPQEDRHAPRSHPKHPDRRCPPLAALPATTQPSPCPPFTVPTLPLAGAIQPNANGALRHSPNLRGMTRSIAGPISSLSAASKPQPGNLIPSRTPEDIGPVAPGEVMQAHIHGLPAIRIHVVVA